MKKFVAQTPFQKHVAKWKECTYCPLCFVRQQVVFARGTYPCDVLFIGEAPGDSEDSKGQPFFGPAGELLDDIIECAQQECGIHSLRYCFTNMIACIPKEFKGGPKMKDPPKKSVVACSPRLVEMVKLAKPKGVVYVGDFAAKYGPGIIGEEFETEHIIHPAAILRKKSDDGRKIVDAAQGLMLKKAVVILSEFMERIHKLC